MWVKITLAENENSYKYSSCIVYTVLFWILFTINAGVIGAYFVCFHWYLKKILLVLLVLKQQFTKNINGIEPIIFPTIKLIKKILMQGC